MKRLLVIVGLALLVPVAQPRAQQNGVVLDKLLASADHKASVEGDLKGAIDDYKRIVVAAGNNRAAAARALLQMAQCYQQLGDAAARKIYQRLVQEFADQKDIALTARVRLGVEATRAAGGPATRALWTLPSAISAQGHVSRDGRWLPFIDWSTGNLALHDFRTGNSIPLTDTGVPNSIPKQQYPGYSRISPDGRRIAFSWFNSQRYELRLLSIDGPGRSLPAVTLYHNLDVEYMHPFAWSPDGAWVAVGLQRVDRTGQLGLVSVRDGSLRVLKSFPWREEMSGIAFSPDGK